jgi:hypothetical protein
VVFRPGRNFMRPAAAGGGAYELTIGGDSRELLGADEISRLRANGHLMIEGSWPAEP